MNHDPNSQLDQTPSIGGALNAHRHLVRVSVVHPNVNGKEHQPNQPKKNKKKKRKKKKQKKLKLIHHLNEYKTNVRHIRI